MEFILLGQILQIYLLSMTLILQVTLMTKNHPQAFAFLWARMKHIAINYHSVCGQVASGQLEVVFVCSKDQLVDVLTKPLSQLQFRALCDKLVEEAPTRLRGPGGVLAQSINTVS